MPEFKHKSVRHRNFYRVLIIPDDKDEPKALSISMKHLKLLRIIAAALVLHILLGFFFYFAYYRLHKKHAMLLVANRQLEENNLRINKLMADFQALESYQERIRRALGVGNSAELAGGELIVPQEKASVPPLSVRPISRQRVSSGMQRGEAPAVRTQPALLRSSSSAEHDLYANLPTLLPANGILTTHYQNDLFGGAIQHRGVDIACNEGDVIRAAGDGVVIFAGWTFDLGNLVILYHGNGYYTYYGHAQQLLVTRGSGVKKGEVIALVGNTGISSAPHLHFEIWKDGVSLDPKDYILELANID